ncbi:disease resistance protein RPV1-like isoform X3 [Vitis riparia]|uniref:disease resistance protein RPV1-like isoform X3 n=1 Tax=Vitis riparia TaxID=96939 RepID=UPI00155A954A|nr:disease resistance protein RPV1-like isoform X3 [Vitis riparia]
MASSSSLKASSSTSNCDGYNYHVFLSFRGEDTRQTFTGHLYANLVARGIHTFRDDEELEKGGDIASDLSRAIKESKIFIIIFSKHFADSKWCLNELVKIIDCMTEKKVVLPVFYHVEPRDVRNQKGSFEDAFSKHAEGADQEKKKTIETWKNALKTAANLSGYHLQNQSEAEFIKRICEDIVTKLNRTPLYMGDNIVGMDFHLKQLKSLIKVEIDEVLMVGIYGIGGIGKTTISKAIYNDISSQFDGSSFLGNVGGKCENDLLKLQKTLLQDILKCERPKFNDINQGITVIKERLRSKRVLIVLDDVDKYMQLENLAGKYGWYGAKSIIIITTKEKYLLEQYEVNVFYEVQKLNHEKSTELFNWWAFKQNTPKTGFESLSNSVVEYADGLPIALKVLGVSLFKKSTEEWESELQKLQEMPNKDVQSVLKVSYDKLDGREKGVFLDIACFFRGKDKNFVSRILGSVAEAVIRNLEDRCLITISENILDMHDLLQQMGRAVVRQEPGKMSRLWDPKDVESVLTRNTGTKAIEGLFVKVSTLNQIQFPANFFAKMRSLRLLKVYDMIVGDLDDFVVDLPKDFEIPSFELRYLHFEGYPLQFLPRNFHAKNLVELDLIGSSIKQLWKENEILDKLKVIDLSYSKDLVEIPNFSSVPNLEILILQGCTRLQSLPRNFHKLEHLRSLSCADCSELKSFPEIKGNMSKLRELNLSGTAIIEVPSSIGRLKALQHLDLSYCKSLRSLSESICNLSSLETLILVGCSNLKGFPEIKDMENLKRLDLSFTGIEELPSSIGHLKALKHLNLKCCTELVSLLDSICNLSSLKTLILEGCSNLKGFPEIKDMANLKRLDLGRTCIEELPSSIGRLKALQHLDLSYCKSLRSLSESICNLSSLETLILAGCSNLKGFPEIKDDMENLKRLDLGETGIEELPSSIGRLKALQHLDLKCCTELVSLPDSICNLSSLETLILAGCSNLKGFPEIKYDMENLKRLDLDRTGIEELPSSIGCLKALQHLDLSYCKSLRSLSESICNLSSLETLILAGCSNLKGFPEIKYDMENLKRLDLDRTGIEELPSSIGCLKALQHLDLSYCKSLRSLSESICNLSSLETLILAGCSNLKGFPEIKDDMENLKRLDLTETGIEELPFSIGRLKALQHLDLSFCKSLRSLLESICNLSSLETLILVGCSNLKGFPEIKYDMENLKRPDLGRTGIEELPSSIGRLKALQHLDLSYCKSLRSLSESICNLSSLKHLDLSWCQNLVNLPESICNLSSLKTLILAGCSNLKGFPEIKDDMENLKRLDLGETGIEELPSSIGHLKALQHLDLSRCKSLRSLPESICNLSSLETLILERCSNLKGFPEIKDDMENLKRLDLGETGIEELPSSIGRLKALQHLDLKCCTELVSLPDSICNLSSLKALDVQECPKLERVEVNLVGSLYLTCWILNQSVIWSSGGDQRVAEVEGEVLNHHVSSLSSLVESCTRDYRDISGDSFHLSALQVLSVGNFSPIQRRILSDIFRQSSLASVSLRNCNLMEEGIPSGFWNLSSLVNLSLSNCSLTEGEILNRICHISSLQNLSLDGNHFSSIPANIIQLSKLRSLCLNHCLKLLQIPELPPSLRVLDVQDCPCLETLSSPSSLLGLSLFKCFESAIEDYDGRFYCQEKVEILMPGNNGIPEWISHKKKGSEIVVELPENWWEDNNFLGFALCSVLEYEEIFEFYFEYYFELTFHHFYPDGNLSESKFRDRGVFSRRRCCNGGESNGVLVAFYPKVAIKNKGWSNEWRHMKASFHGKREKVEECGLHLIYKKQRFQCHQPLASVIE